MEDFFSLLLAFVEAPWIRAHNHYSKVDGEIPRINVQDELFGYARYADRRPSLATVFHAGVSINIIHQDLDILRLNLRNLIRICKDAYWIHRAYKHTTCKSLGEVLFNTLLYNLPSLIGHPQWLKSLQEDRRALLTDVAHHVHGPL